MLMVIIIMIVLNVKKEVYLQQFPDEYRTNEDETFVTDSLDKIMILMKKNDADVLMIYYINRIKNKTN